MPVLTHMGPAAPCGLHRYESRPVRQGVREQPLLLPVQPAEGQPARPGARRARPSTTKDSDFVVSDNIDFHPTDVIEDADGSLLIVDTGGWYKLCCPTSQLVKPDVTGAIYRVKKVGAHKVDDPRGQKIEWEGSKPADLPKLLGTRGRRCDSRAARRVRPGRTAADVDWQPEPMSAPTASQRSRLAHRVERCTGSTVTPSRSDCTAAGPRHGAAVRGGFICLGSIATTRAVTLLDADGVGADGRARPPGGRGGPRADRLIEATSPSISVDALADEKNDRALDHCADLRAHRDRRREGDSRRARRTKSPRVRACRAGGPVEHARQRSSTRSRFSPNSTRGRALRDTAWWIAGRHPQWGDDSPGTSGRS